MSIPFGVPIPFVEHLGITLEKFEDGQSELWFPMRPEIFNSFDVVHGGAIMTFLDIVLAAAARSVEPSNGVFTIEMKTSFMQAASAPLGGRLIGRGRLLHRTRKLAFTEGGVYDPEGRLCAHATGTFKYVPRRGTDGLHTD